jgi:alpha-galactosidase
MLTLRYLSIPALVVNLLLMTSNVSAAQGATPDGILPKQASVKLPEAVAKKPLAKKPPLGWNSYDSYRNYIGEDEAMQNLDIFAQKLAPHGYEYFVIDLGWYSENALIPGTNRPWATGTGVERLRPYDLRLNSYGYPVGSQTFFPHGIKRIADHAHELGVKFGLHMMRGMLRKAWEFNLPVKGTPYHMRDIGDPNSICPWSTLTYGVDMTKPGAQEFYDGLIQHLADLGVDFIKYDDIVPYPAEMEAIGKAVAKCQRDIVLSFNPGNDATVPNKSYYQWSHLVTITGDVWDWRSSTDETFLRWRAWQRASEPGFWINLDMLCLGTLTGSLDRLDPSLFKRRKSEDLGQGELDKIGRAHV